MMIFFLFINRIEASVEEALKGGDIWRRTHFCGRVGHSKVWWPCKWKSKGLIKCSQHNTRTLAFVQMDRLVSFRGQTDPSAALGLLGSFA